MKKILSLLSWPIKKILLFLIVTIRPLLGPANCRFPISCGNYGIDQLKTQPLHRALFNIIKRLLSCANPFWKKSYFLSILIFLFPLFCATHLSAMKPAEKKLASVNPINCALSIKDGKIKCKLYSRREMIKETPPINETKKFCLMEGGKLHPLPVSELLMLMKKQKGMVVVAQTDTLLEMLHYVDEQTGLIIKEWASLIQTENNKTIKWKEKNAALEQKEKELKKKCRDLQKEEKNLEAWYQEAFSDLQKAENDLQKREGNLKKRKKKLKKREKKLKKREKKMIYRCLLCQNHLDCRCDNFR